MSRAQLIDERPEEDNNETDVVDQQETFESQEEEVAQPSTIPEKYQGKSLEDVVQMHQEALRLVNYGRSLTTTFRHNSHNNKHLYNSKKKTI
jgi:hypothetical protein